ncbi:MAG: DUF362 domain-containing protein [bacterium]|nr:DUF362 domain-containing protein [bacterium]
MENNLKAKVGIGYGNNRIECVRKAFAALGGIQQWVKPGHKVLLKPNIMAAQGGAQITHIDTLKGLYLLCKEAGAKEVWVGENSVCGMPPRIQMGIIGYDRALEDIGMKVIFFDEEDWVYRFRGDNYCLKDIHIPKSLVDADVWITVPVAKTHEACLTTLGLKNSHGILPDEDKARHHRGRPFGNSSLWEKFVDIYAISKPHLCVTDMFHAMEGQGPAFGDIVEMKLVVASADSVACDATVEALMGFENLECPLTRIAHKRGLGIGDMNQIQVVGENILQHRRHFKRALWHPDTDRPYYGIRILAGDVCHGGCQMIVRYLIDLSHILFKKMERELGPIYIMVGDNPPPPPEKAFILVFGDCAIYSTWHYQYRRRPQMIGPWWKPRKGYIDVKGCVPVQLEWIRSMAHLVEGYDPMAALGDAVSVVEADQITFAEGISLEKNPRRWNFDREWARKYSREIQESKPPRYIYAANESIKGQILRKTDPEVDRILREAGVEPEQKG